LNRPPAIGRFIAYHIEPGRAGRAGREISGALVGIGKRISPRGSFLAIDRSGLLWMATTNGLVRFDRVREQYTTMTSALACRTVQSTTSRKIATGGCG
jgi:hypothetical protein